MVEVSAHLVDEVLPARSLPQGELPFDQPVATGDWPEMDQTAGQGDGWE